MYTEMIILDYVYNKYVLNVILDINIWYPTYQKIPKFKEAIKIFISVLHQVYFDFLQDVVA